MKDMTGSQVAASERRAGTQDIIGKLLSERQDLTVQFVKVAGLNPMSDPAPHGDMLQEFCQVLIDYSAFGHFEIYERIVDGRERRTTVVSIAREVYGRIVEASETAVDFNDKYDSSDHTLDMHALDKDLCHLGEELAIRFEMEDRIIGALLEEKK